MRLYELTRPNTINLDEYLKDKGFKPIGSGHFAVVYEHPNFDYILKIFSKKDTAYIDFIKNKPNLKCFPKVIGKPVHFNDDTYAVRLEKLKLYPSHKLINDNDLSIEYEKKQLANILVEIFFGKEKFKNYADTIMYNYIKKYTDLLDGLNYIKSTKYRQDLGPNNIMFRDDYPVIIDPFFDLKNIPSVSLKKITSSNLNNLTPLAAYDIARNKKTRDKQLENIIAKDPSYAFNYAVNQIKGRWPEGEEKIKTDPELAYEYVAKIIRGRWPEAEPTIMTDTDFAVDYAKNIIGGRWPEAEPYIIKDIENFIFYVLEIVKKRLPEYEPIIRKTKYWNMYKNHFDIK